MDKSKLFKAAGGLKWEDRYRKGKAGRAWFLVKVNSRMGVPYIQTCFKPWFEVITVKPSTFQGGNSGSFTSLYYVMKIKSSV